jgi:hypothetical protein
MNKVLERTGFRLFECGSRELDGGGAGASLLKALWRGPSKGSGGFGGGHVADVSEIGIARFGVVNQPALRRAV